MKKNRLFITLISSFLLFGNCDNTNIAEENHCDFLAIVGEPNILGKWQVYEKGGSPGFGYFIEKVPSIPAQTVEFKANNVLVTNFLGDFHFYYVINHPSTNENIVALYKTEQNPEEIRIENLERSYSISQCANGNISLGYRYCYEGCHYGLKRIE